MDLSVTVELAGLPGEIDIVYDGVSFSFFPDNRAPAKSKKIFLVAKNRISGFGFGVACAGAPVNCFEFNEKIIDTDEKREYAQFFVAFLYQLFYVLQSMSVPTNVVLASWIEKSRWSPVEFTSEVPLIF